MAKHMDIDAVWSFSPQDLAHTIEAGSATNIKRTWITQNPATKEALLHATEVKNVWVPYGE
jgi:aldehyde dehydrogenase (NAD+)